MIPLVSMQTEWGPGTHGPQPCLIWPGFSHEVSTKSRACDHLLAALPAQAVKQGARAGAEHGVAPVRRELCQRHEHKGAPVRLGMRQDQPRPATPTAWPAQAPAAVVQDVDIERARPQRPAGAAAGLAFQALDEAQERSRWEPGLGDGDGVEI